MKAYVMYRNKIIPKPEDIYFLTLYLRDIEMNQEQILKFICDCKWDFKIDYIEAEGLIQKIITEAFLYPECIKIINIFQIEIDYLKAINISKEYKKYIQKTLFELLIYWKRNMHSSGWVKYNKNIIFKEIKINKIISLPLLSKYGFELRVLGKKEPITCFKLIFGIQEEFVQENNIPVVITINLTDDIDKIFEQLFPSEQM